MTKEDVVMNSQNVGTITGDEQTKPQTMPRRDANGASADGETEEWDLDELVDHMPVPPRRVVTFSVCYRHLGRGRPLLYPLEEDRQE
jgi:hypothetical protein